MIILDTNVVSALMMERPDSVVAAWLDAHSAGSVWTTSLTILEIRAGIELMANGRRKSRLETEFEYIVRNDLGERVLSFDRVAADAAGRLMATRKRNGMLAEIRDTMIAGIALAQSATLATRNIRHFDDAGIALVDPWQS